MLTSKAFITSLILWISQNNAGLLPNFEPKDINLPTIKIVDPALAVELKYGKRHARHLEDHYTVNLRRSFKGYYFHDKNEIWLSSWMVEEQPGLAKITLVHELAHAIQSQSGEMTSFYECHNKLEPAAYLVGYIYQEHEILKVKVINFESKLWHNMQEIMHDEFPCSPKDKASWQKLQASNNSSSLEQYDEVLPESNPGTGVTDESAPATDS